jgi:rhamnosyltransferase
VKTPPGLIITFNPSKDFFARFESLYKQLDKILLVDNGSGPEICYLLDQEARRKGEALTVVFNETNLGVATALNQGFRWAIEQGYDCLLALDQDSNPETGMIPVMLEVFSKYSLDDQLAVVAPVIYDPTVSFQSRFLRPKGKFLFERVSCQRKVLKNITYAITSGSLFDLAAYQEIGPFRDDFFIDYVDTEYCLRARKLGYRIIVACEAHLNHRQGERERRKLLGHDLYPTFHSPLRWYYISRNRIPMLHRYALRFPHWFFYDSVATVYIMMKMLLFETQKLAKLHACWLGIRDGLQGRMGEAPDDVLKAIG